MRGLYVLVSCQGYYASPSSVRPQQMLPKSLVSLKVGQHLSELNLSNSIGLRPFPFNDFHSEALT